MKETQEIFGSLIALSFILSIFKLNTVFTLVLKRQAHRTFVKLRYYRTCSYFSHTSDFLLKITVSLDISVVNISNMFTTTQVRAQVVVNNRNFETPPHCVSYV